MPALPRSTSPAAVPPCLVRHRPRWTALSRYACGVCVAVCSCCGLLAAWCTALPRGVVCLFCNSCPRGNDKVAPQDLCVSTLDAAASAAGSSPHAPRSSQRSGTRTPGGDAAPAPKPSPGRTHGRMRSRTEIEEPGLGLPVTLSRLDASSVTAAEYRAPPTQPITAVTLLAKGDAVPPGFTKVPPHHLHVAAPPLPPRSPNPCVVTWLRLGVCSWTCRATYASPYRSAAPRWDALCRWLSSVARAPPSPVLPLFWQTVASPFHLAISW